MPICHNASDSYDQSINQVEAVSHSVSQKVNQLIRMFKVVGCCHLKDMNIILIVNILSGLKIWLCVCKATYRRRSASENFFYILYTMIGFYLFDLELLNDS